MSSTLQAKLTQLMQQLQLEDMPAGGSVVVYKNSELIAQACVGEATPDLKWDKNTLSLNFSTGKGVLVTLIHVLVSNDLLDYEQRIAHYWPQFAANGKQDIRLIDVLTHRSGLFNIQQITESADDMTDWGLMLERVEQLEPQATFNEQAESAYSALVSGWVLGGLIEKVTGLTLNEALAQYLTEPLGIADSVYFGVPADKVQQVATPVKNFDNFDQLTALTDDNEQGDEAKQAVKKRSSKPKLRLDSEHILEVYQSLPSYECWQHADTQSDGENETNLGTADIAKLYLDMSQIKIQDFKYALVPAGRSGFDYYTAESLMAKIPAANNVASAEALATMYAMLANKGQWLGQQLIRPEVFEQLSAIHVKGGDAIMPATEPNSMQWRLGYHRLFSRCHDTDKLQNMFGHMGYNGSVAWCDVESNTAVAYVHNYDVTMTTDIRQFALIEAILAWTSEDS
ncbi:serine hydrolase domain-containing protein [Psychrobacter sp. FDAARGOS_221]|uniref:serine hydrolase domain-containing protein n=1 Tax=Psychrobacter sp. FDAARGOS_221 TaxID=1975705 RepID=UPI000BB5632D|nr:serine hydrolase domain-containing protein [Psychrobacter sp. FDAARGOS_221]PNK59712.1 serine hydrolase [Psychrobacter sp. FDAARGOS_221]